MGKRMQDVVILYYDTRKGNKSKNTPKSISLLHNVG